MAVPGLLPPQKIGETTLIDGGLAANVPIAIAQNLGADILIVVDLSTQPQKAEEIDDVLGVLGQITAYLTLKNAQEDIARLGDHDVLIAPEFDGFNAASFGKAKPLIKIGRKAIDAKADELAQFARRAAGGGQGRAPSDEPIAIPSSKTPPIVMSLRLENNTDYPDDFVLGAISQEIGAALNYDALASDIDNIYGLDEFGIITYRLDERAPGQADLVIRLEPTDRGDLYARFGLELATDFSSGADFNLTAGVIRRNVTARGGEFRGALQIGDNPGLFLEFYQPTDARHTWFGAVGARVAREPINIFDENQNSVAQANLDIAELDISAGRVIDRRLELRTGFRRQWTRLANRTGLQDVGLPFGESATSFFTRLTADSFDAPFFPHKGVLGEIEFDYNFSNDAARDLDPSSLEGLITAAFPIGARGALLPSAEFGFAFDGGPVSLPLGDETLTFSGTQTLGGPRRLSGLRNNSLVGRHKALGSLTYYHAVLQGSGFRDGGLYIGGSFEAGNVYDNIDAIDFDTLRLGGSLFVGGPTIIGPVILGVGVTEDNVAAFLRVGPTFSRRGF